MFRRTRSLLNPFTRTAVMAFAWTHRHEIMRWGRSLWAELRRPGRPDPKRVMTIGRVLWAITSDDAVSRARQLREVRLDGDVLVVDASTGWKRMPQLVAALRDVDGIDRIVDAQGRTIAAGAPIPASSIEVG